MIVKFINCPACNQIYIDTESKYHCKKCYQVICERCKKQFEAVHQNNTDICPFCSGDITTNDMKLEEIRNLINEYRYNMSINNLIIKIEEILNRN